MRSPRHAPSPACLSDLSAQGAPAVLSRRDFLGRSARSIAAAAGFAGSVAAGGCSHTAGKPPATGTADPPSPIVPMSARFVDATKEAGLDFVQTDCACGMRYFVEQVASGATVIDANGDGYPDLYFPQPIPLGQCVAKYPRRPHHRLYINNQRGGFRPAPDAFHGVDTDYGIAAAAGDYDNDGCEDLFVACFGKCKLFHNRGDGTFEDVTEKAGVGVQGFCTGAVWFDYNGDGLLDLYVLRYCEWDLQHDIPCLAPDGKRDNCNPTIYKPSTNFLFRNNGDGTFTDVTAQSGAAPEHRRSLDAAAFDFDGDGRLDLFVSNDLGPNYLLHNRGDGTFQDVAMQEAVAGGLTGLSQANMGIAVGDYNDTGRPSVLVTTFADEPFTLYRNDGGYFTDVSAPAGIAQVTLPYLGFGTGFFDSRNSGRLDLFFANGHVSPFAYLRNPKHTFKEHNLVLLNDGTAHFVDAPDALPRNDVRVHRGACFADFRNNGRIDVVVTANNDRPTLLRNESPSGNWLKLQLKDRHGCATPVGTRCIAQYGGKQRLRVVLGGGSYGGDSDHRVHFGLGTAVSVDRLEIHWMSGFVQALLNVSANQILKVVEPPGK